MPSPTRKAPPPPLQTYGLLQRFPKLVNAPEAQRQLTFEQMAFRHRQPISRGGLPREDHLRNMSDILCPWIKWNPWMERMIEALCNNQWVGMTGCSSSTKTTTSVFYAILSWLCAPDCTTVILTSTTKGMIRKRAWPWLQKIYTRIPGERIGNLVDSRTIWQNTKGDDLNAIFAVAVEEGSTAKAMSNIQGIHNKRIIVIVDEATDTPEAIFDVCVNLIAGCDDFQFICLGNAASRFDPHGKFCEPKDGWNSVSVDDEEYESVPQLNNVPGKILHFDGFKSPNIIAGQILYPYLPKKAEIDGYVGKMGASSPLTWKFQRGWWAPEGIVQTVLTESLLKQHDAVGARSQHIFTGETPVFNIASCDPAFGGGDRPIWKMATVGGLPNGSVGIQLKERKLLEINARSPLDIHYQLAAQIKSLCLEHNVLPGFFGMDVTGEGGGLSNILAREWSPDFIKVEFGGKPSELPASNEDRRPCTEVYVNKVAELWYSIKEFVCSGQLKGLQHDEANELCTRLWRLKGKKIEVEPKTSRKFSGDAEESSKWGYRERMGTSCDLGDAIAIIVFVARRHGAVARVLGQTAKRDESWFKMAMKADEVYQEDAAEEPGGLQVSFSLDDGW